MSGSKFFKRLWRVTLLLGVLLIAAGVAIYVVASWVPQRYRPSDLPERERHEAAKEFVNQPLAEFANRVQAPEPFTITVTQDQFNAYLASMDEIAALAPNGRPGEVRAQMDRAGLAQPCVAIGEGVLTLMVGLSDYGKVLSADLAFDLLGDGRLQIRLRAVRVGRLPVPQWLVHGALQRLQQSLAAAAPRHTREGSLRNITIDDVAALMAKVAESIDENPIPTELPMKVGGRKLRVNVISLHEGTLTLGVGAAPATASPPPH